jgi:methylmalonyl-CoA mutase
MEPLLFSEFSLSTKETWKKLATSELGDNVDGVSWKLADTLFVDPYYTASELNSDHISAIQDAQRRSTGWLNTPSVKLETPLETNQRIRSALSTGADAILLDLGNKSIPACELVKTLHSIRLNESFIFFSTNQNPSCLYDEIEKVGGSYLKGGIAYDPIALWMQTGIDLNQSLEQIAKVLHQTKQFRDFRPFMVENHWYHQAGANHVQELAAMIATLVHCADFLTDAGISPLHALNRFFFSVSIGPDYLSEIAKLRALRLLYRKVTQAYQLPDELCNAFVHTRTSLFYHSELEPTTNLVRATSEAMSAVIGGCDAMTVSEYQKGDVFADRVAQNVSLLLAEEAKMNHVADPAAGSYLIETMSHQLVDAAWKLFLQIEDQGGIVNSLNHGFIQSEIAKARVEKSRPLPDGKTMVGVNIFSDREVTTDQSNQPQVPEIKTDGPQPLPQQPLEAYLRRNR